MLMPEPYAEHHDTCVLDYRTTGIKKIIGVGRDVQGKRRDGDVFPMELAVAEWHDRNQRFFTGIVRDNSSRVTI